MALAGSGTTTDPWTVKANDTGPALTVTLYQAANEGDLGAINLGTIDAPEWAAVLDLSLATTMMLRLKFSTGVSGGGAMTLVGAASAGTVRYKWAPGDLAIVGKTRAEVEILWTDGTITTIPGGEANASGDVEAATSYFWLLIVEDNA